MPICLLHLEIFYYRTVYTADVGYRFAINLCVSLLFHLLDRSPFRICAILVNSRLVFVSYSIFLLTKRDRDDSKYLDNSWYHTIHSYGHLLVAVFFPLISPRCVFYLLLKITSFPPFLPSLLSLTCTVLESCLVDSDCSRKKGEWVVPCAVPWWEIAQDLERGEETRTRKRKVCSVASRLSAERTVFSFLDDCLSDCADTFDPLTSLVFLFTCLSYHLVSRYIGRESRCFTLLCRWNHLFRKRRRQRRSLHWSPSLVHYCYWSVV